MSITKGQRRFGEDKARFLPTLIISVSTLLTVSVIAALISGSLGDPTAALPTVSFISLTLSSGLSGMIIARTLRGTSLGSVTLASLLIVLIMLFINLIISKGNVLPSALMNYLTYVALTVGAYYLLRPRGRKRR